MKFFKIDLEYLAMCSILIVATSPIFIYIGILLGGGGKFLFSN